MVVIAANFEGVCTASAAQRMASQPTCEPSISPHPTPLSHRYQPMYVSIGQLRRTKDNRPLLPQLGILFDKDLHLLPRALPGFPSKSNSESSTICLHFPAPTFFTAAISKVSWLSDHSHLTFFELSGPCAAPAELSPPSAEGSFRFLDAVAVAAAAASAAPLPSPLAFFLPAGDFPLPDFRFLVTHLGHSHCFKGLADLDGKGGHAGNGIR